MSDLVGKMFVITNNTITSKKLSDLINNLPKEIYNHLLWNEDSYPDDEFGFLNAEEHWNRIKSDMLHRGNINEIVEPSQEIICFLLTNSAGFPEFIMSIKPKYLMSKNNISYTEVKDICEGLPG